MEVRIDRLCLQVDGMNADMARQFGRAVAERLGVALAAQPPAPGPARFARLHVAVPAVAADVPDGLAAAMAAEISRALRLEATR